MAEYRRLRGEWTDGTLTPHEAKEAPRKRTPNLAGHRDAAPLYGPDDLEAMGFDPARDLGVPGSPPFTRGVQPNMHRGRLWTMRQYAGFGTARESNERYGYRLAQGQTGLSVAFDLPTQMGRDSDDPRARGEVGRVGVAIDSVEDMRELLRDVPLDKISTSMTINATAATLLCLYVAVAEEQGIARAALRGTVQNDILKEYIARGTYIYPPLPSLLLHCQRGGVTLTAQQPLVNVARVTVQTLAAVLGGCQSLHTNSYDEALGLPTSEAATIALRTQQVVAHESGVADFVDALAGSYAVESLTSGLETSAREYIARIDELGGMVAAIEQGYPQREIQRTSYEHQLEVERKERVVVGVNAYVQDAAPVPVMKVDPRIESEQVDRLRAMRARRDAPAHAAALERVERAARGHDNVLPHVLDAVKAYATVGEIANVLRGVWGEHVETLVV